MAKSTTSCPACTTPNAYIGYSAVECVNRDCRNFSQKWLAEKSANFEVIEMPGIRNLKPYVGSMPGNGAGNNVNSTYGTVTATAPIVAPPNVVPSSAPVGTQIFVRDGKLIMKVGDKEFDCTSAGGAGIGQLTGDVTAP